MGSGSGCVQTFCDPKRPDCSGYIAAVSFALVFIFAAIMMFYLLSGPPTFLNVQMMSPEATIFFDITYNPVWCSCVQFETVIPKQQPVDVRFLRLPPGSKIQQSPDLTHYSLSQQTDDKFDPFQYYAVIMHPGSSASATYQFNQAADVYFARALDVDGLQRDPNFQETHSVQQLQQMNGTISAPIINASDTYAFVFMKNFETQASFNGTVEYQFELTELEVPHVAPVDELVNNGRFCWGTDGYKHKWLLAAGSGQFSLDKAQIELTCVPRYAVTAPIICVPVILLIILEIVIIWRCIIVKNRQRFVGDYEEIIN